MEVTIVKGNMDYIADCEDALVKSELGFRYFSEEGSARKALEEGFEKEQIYIAVDSNNNCLGFIWYILDGIFHSFPYLHIIAVKKESRNHGIGKKLLKYFEDICFKEYTKIFLVVADFNPGAKRLYKKLGYIEVGSVPNLYREGIIEYIMMKVRNKSS
jgi:ribosomal protein S18 acetylase RimI-like enzyme